MAIVDAGDSLEENFILNDDGSDTDTVSDVSDNCKNGTGSEDSVSGEGQSAIEGNAFISQKSKKQKLNWREGASVVTGSVESQVHTLTAALEAFSTFFPNEPAVLTGDDFSSISFLDCSEFAERSEKSTSDLFNFLRIKGFLNPSSGVSKILNTIIVSGSGTRAMYLVKELREFDSGLAPLPLFFHGGGRKKEQAVNHEATLRGLKTSVAVCLPSRLRYASARGLIDYSNVNLILFDLKTNEKRLNVLSQKDTLREVYEWLADVVREHSHEKFNLALV